MSEQQELEFLVQVAEDRISFFDSYQPPKFPENFADHVQQLIQDISDSKPPSESMIQTVRESGHNAASIHELLRYQFFARDVAHSDVNRLILKYFGKDMEEYFSHDGLHISELLQKIVMRTFPLTESGNVGRILRSDISRFYNIDENVKKITKMYSNPWRLIRRLAMEKLGKLVEYHNVNIKDHLINVAEVLAGRFDQSVLIANSKPANPPNNSIVVYGNDISILSDHGLIWGVGYNNMKNSQIKFVDRKNNTHPRISYASCHDLGGYVVMVFSDSGSALDINKMITLIRKAMIERGGELDWGNAEMQRAFRSWSKNDYAFNLITMQQITNVAFMARMSGSEYSYLSSGMGLFGTRYIIEHLGGAILYTTTFKKENPVFTYILPKEPKASAAGARQLKKYIIHKGLKVA